MAVARKVFDDILVSVWEEAYHAGFDDGTDNQTSSSARFAAGYIIGYDDAVHKHPPMYTGKHSAVPEKLGGVPAAKSRLTTRC